MWFSIYTALNNQKSHHNSSVHNPPLSLSQSQWRLLNFEEKKFIFDSQINFHLGSGVDPWGGWRDGMPSVHLFQSTPALFQIANYSKNICVEQVNKRFAFTPGIIQKIGSAERWQAMSLVDIFATLATQCRVIHNEIRWENHKEFNAINFLLVKQVKL